MILNSFLDFDSKYFLEIGDFKIAWYAFCIFTGIILALIVGLYEAKRFGIKQDDIIDGLLLCAPVAIIACRIYYVIFHPEGIIVEGDFWLSVKQLFGIYDDGFRLAGLSILGAIIYSSIFVVFYCKRKKINVFEVFDLLAPGLLIGQICGRWGNFFNQEAHGGVITEEQMAVLSKLIPSFIMDKMYIDGAYYHPTFLYELLLNLVLLIVIFVLRRVSKKYQIGDSICLYLVGYGVIRAFAIEPFRTDALMLGDIRINIVVPLILSVIGIVWFILKRVNDKFRQPSYIETQKIALNKEN